MSKSEQNSSFSGNLKAQKRQTTFWKCQDYENFVVTVLRIIHGKVDWRMKVTNKFKVLATAMFRGTPWRFCYTSCSYLRGTGSFVHYTAKSVHKALKICNVVRLDIFIFRNCENINVDWWYDENKNRESFPFAFPILHKTG